MKDILISSSSSPDAGSGISTYAKEIAGNLSVRGFNIHFLSPIPEDTSWLTKYNIAHITSDPDAPQEKMCREIFEYIKQKHIDAVINNDNPVIASISPALKCPIISIGHLEKHTIASIATYNTQWLDYVVAISNDMKQSFTRKFNTPVSKCPVVHNGIQKTTSNIKNKNNKKLKLIFAGEYTKRKGSDLILKMILARHSVWNEIELNWYGDVPEKAQKKARENPNVTIHGRVPRNTFLESMKNSDIFLMSSRDEGCPMSMLEAMSYGVIPITSNGRGAMQWLIDHGIHGYVCDLKDWPSQALTCISSLHENRNLLNDMSSSLLEHFNTNHLTERTTEKLLKLLSNPTVDRSTPEKKIDVLKWHRPKKYSFLGKIYWKLGILKIEKNITL